jgi:hypothetical protein
MPFDISPNNRVLYMLSNKNYRVAIGLVRCGIRIFPAKPERKPDGSWNKPPCITDWCSNATTDPNQIRDWWQCFPEAIPAMPCDEFVVVDADRHLGGADGVAALHNLIREHGEWPDHFVVTTPNNGQHHYFCQSDPPLGNSVGVLPPGIDVRGIGGYVIGPGAILPDDTSWQSIHSGSSAPEWPLLPRWLDVLIRANKPCKAVVPHIGPIASRPLSGREERYAIAALAGVAQEISAAPLGKRNTILNAAAYRMGRMVSAGWIDRNTVENELRLAAHALANDDGIKSVVQTIESGLDAGCSDPHPPLANRKRGWK